MKQDSEKNAGKRPFNPKDMVEEHIPNVYGPPPMEQDVVYRLVEEPISCVYGPPEWYDRNGNLDDNHPSVSLRKSESKTYDV